MNELCESCDNLNCGCTTLLNGKIITENYCGLTRTDEFCDGELYSNFGDI